MVAGSDGCLFAVNLPAAEQPLDVGELQLDVGRAGRGCTGRNSASPPSRAGARSSPRAAGGGRRGSSRGRTCATGPRRGAARAGRPPSRRRRPPRRRWPPGRRGCRSRGRAPRRRPARPAPRAPAPRRGRTPRCDEAEPVEVRRGGDQALGVVRVSSTTSGISSPWRAMPPAARSALQALVDEALVGGVLVDDDDAVPGLGDDVGLVELRAGRAERMVDRLGRVGDRRHPPAAGPRLGAAPVRRRRPAAPRRSRRRRRASAAVAGSAGAPPAAGCR